MKQQKPEKFCHVGFIKVVIRVAAGAATTYGRKKLYDLIDAGKDYIKDKVNVFWLL